LQIIPIQGWGEIRLCNLALFLRSLMLANMSKLKEQKPELKRKGHDQTVDCGFRLQIDDRRLCYGTFHRKAVSSEDHP